MTGSESNLSSTEEVVLTAIARTLRVDAAEVQPNHRVDSLGLDSMRLMAVIARVEVLCAVEFSTEHIVSFLQAELVSDLIGRIENVVQAV
jgi:acyl carrier protein